MAELTFAHYHDKYLGNKVMKAEEGEKVEARMPGGLLSRLRKQPHKLPLLSIFLNNTRFLIHKMDELEFMSLCIVAMIENCCP